MALTKTISRIMFPFPQPSVGGTVIVKLLAAIDYFKVGVHVYILDGGVYEIIGNAAYTYTLILKEADQVEGALIQPKVVYPVLHKDGDLSAKTLRVTVASQTNIFQDDRLIGAEIIGQFMLNKVPYDYVEDGILFDPIFGTLNFSAVGGLYQGDKLLIVITSGQSVTPPGPQPAFEYFRQKEKFTSGTGQILTLAHDILSSEDPQVFYRGVLVDDGDYIIGTDTITLNFQRENDAIIHIYYVAKLTI